MNLIRACSPGIELTREVATAGMLKSKKRPSPKSIPRTSKMMRSQNAPSKQQRDHNNEREDFISPAAARIVPGDY
jgi:hypothetical protein